MRKKKDLLAKLDDSVPSVLPKEREGYFKQGRDKLGRPYEKKMDTTGLYTKQEILKDGTQKLTIKKKPFTKD